MTGNNQTSLHSNRRRYQRLRSPIFAGCLLWDRPGRKFNGGESTGRKILRVSSTKESSRLYIEYDFRAMGLERYPSRRASAPVPPNIENRKYLGDIEGIDQGCETSVTGGRKDVRSPRVVFLRNEVKITESRSCLSSGSRGSVGNLTREPSTGIGNSRKFEVSRQWDFHPIAAAGSIIEGQASRQCRGGWTSDDDCTTPLADTVSQRSFAADLSRGLSLSFVGKGADLDESGNLRFYSASHLGSRNERGESRLRALRRRPGRRLRPTNSCFENQRLDRVSRSPCRLASTIFTPETRRVPRDFLLSKIVTRFRYSASRSTDHGLSARRGTGAEDPR